MASFGQFQVKFLKRYNKMSAPGGHKVTKGAHFMNAFGGCIYNASERASTRVCMT